MRRRIERRFGGIEALGQKVSHRSPVDVPGEKLVEG